jgi:RND family efflux transporter MFP subunit
MSRRVLLVASALALLAGCSKHPAEPVSAAGPATIVATAPVVAADLPVLTEVTGSVRAVQRATVAAKVMGSIARLPVALGQPVAAGDLLLEIAAPEIAARVDQARAQLSLTERELTRDRALAARGAVTEDQVRALEDRLAIHAAQLREAETALGYTQLRAPFAGTVARKLVDAGDLAVPGQPLLELDGAGAFEIEVAVPDSLAGALAVGQSLDVTIPASGRRFPARLAELSTSADATARAIALKLAVPAESGVRPGQFARVAVPSTPVPTLLVPASAVTRVGQMERVFVVTAGHRAALRLVKTGAARGEQLEVLSGLDAGERVIVAPSATLREGAPVEVRP